MSTLTDKITEALEAHAAIDWDDNELVNGRYQAVWYCPCGEMVPLDDFGQHLSSAIAAVVAEWLTSPASVHVVAAELLGRTATMGALDGLAALAAEAVKGAGQ